MGRKSDIEQELSSSKEQRNRCQQSLDKMLNSMSTIRDDNANRIKRFESYLALNSCSEKDKMIYAEKRAEAIKQSVEFEEKIESFKDELNKKLEETNNKIEELEKELEACEENEETEEEKDKELANNENNN